MWDVNLTFSLPKETHLISRLRPVACVIWGEEALAWIHGVSTYIFDTLHLLVPEHQLLEASHTLVQLLPVYAPADPCIDYTCKWLFFGREGAFPSPRQISAGVSSSILFTHTAFPPDQQQTDVHNHLTPDAFFHMSATNSASLVSLPPSTLTSLNTVRVPALPTFYGALLSTIHAPASVRAEHSFGLKKQLKICLGQLHLYRAAEYVRGWYKEIHELPEPIRDVGFALRPDNPPRFWEMWFWDEPYSDDEECNWRCSSS